MKPMLALVALATMVVIPALGVAAPVGVPAAAGPRITFDITVGDSCWTGTARPAGARIVTRVETPDGHVKGKV